MLYLKTVNISVIRQIIIIPPSEMCTMTFLVFEETKVRKIFDV